MKKLLIFATILISFQAVMAQQKGAKMSFAETSHDFGKIKENGGLAVYKFDFTNTGDQPIIITNVQASCGCTTPDWPKQPIAPGAKGTITVSFDPKGRPSTFNKQITVTSNAINNPVVLTITGDVSPKDQTVDDIYMFKMGDLRLKSNNVTFATIYSNEVKTVELEVINISAKPLAVSFEKSSVPKHITLEAVPATLGANATGKIVVKYDGAKKGDWDFVTDFVYILLNNQKDALNRLTISATIKEKFTQAQKNNPPAIKFESETFDFGKIKDAKELNIDFKYTNTGKSDLIVRKVKSTCGCISSDAKNMVVKAGKSGTIKVKFNPKDLVGKQIRLLTVVTNIPDDEKSRIVLKIQGEVEK